MAAATTTGTTTSRWSIAAVAWVTAASAACSSSAVSDPAPRRGGPPCLTIVTGALPDGCAGGEYSIDGEMRGRYPVTCAPVPAGEHVVGLRSASDCAGYLDCRMTFANGETILDVRRPACRK
jgi:hypothetical protein